MTPARRVAPDRKDREIERLKHRLAAAEARAREIRAEERGRFSALSTASRRFAHSMRHRMDERQRQQRRQDAQYALSRVLEENRDLPTAGPEIFRALGTRLGWAAGALWMVEAGALVCKGTWRSDGHPAGSFEEACRDLRLPRGAGLPGRVWEREKPCWIEDVLEDEGYVRRAEAAAGELRCALAFPVQNGGRLVGVFELLKREPSPTDEDLLGTAYLLGHQMGQFVERWRAEAERDLALFREREARTQTSGILESINDAFFAIDRNWRFTYVNRRTEEFWRRSRGDLLGKDLWEVFPEATDSEVERGLRRAMEGRETVGLETLSPASKVWISVRAYPSADGLSVYFQDISERKEIEAALQRNEARWRALIDKGADVITISDRDGIVTYASPSLVTVCGHTIGEFVGKNPLDEGNVHPDDVERCKAAFAELAGEPGRSLDIQHRYRHGSGEWRWLEGTFTNLFEDPDIGGLVANFRDVTARVEAEGERDRLLVKEWVAAAEAAERERISRELHDRVAHSMGVAHQSLQLHAVLADKDAARAAEKLELAKEMAKVSLESTRNLSAELRSQEAEEGLETELRHLLEVAVPPDVRTEISVRGDEALVPNYVRGQLFLILREAVRNAVAHSGCASILVGLRIEDGKVAGSVEDDGVGFDANNGHAGVGIRSMRERAALLDGTLDLRCAPGRGTRVAIVVPLKGER